MFCNHKDNQGNSTIEFGSIVYHTYPAIRMGFCSICGEAVREIDGALHSAENQIKSNILDRFINFFRK